MQNRRFQIALFGLGFAGAVAFVPGTLDAFMTARWAIFAAVVPLLLVWMGRDVAPVPRLVFAGLALSAVTLLWTPDFASGFDDFMHLAILAAAFWLGASLTNATHLWQGVAAGVAVSAAIALAQWGFGWDQIAQAAAPGGLFANKNFLAEAGMIALLTTTLTTPVTWLARILAGAALLAVVLGGSKAVFGALIIVFAFWLSPRRPALSWAVMTVAVALAVAALALPIDSAAARIPMWRDAFADVAILGHGIGSFATVFPAYEHAHSEPVQLFYEFGLVAVVPAVIFWKAMEGWCGETEGFVLIGLVAVSLWAFPFHLPLSGFAAAVAAGRLFGARDRLVRRRLDWRFAVGAGAQG